MVRSCWLWPPEMSPAQICCASGEMPVALGIQEGGWEWVATDSMDMCMDRQQEETQKAAGIEWGKEEKKNSGYKGGLKGSKLFTVGGEQRSAY